MLCIYIKVPRLSVCLCVCLADFSKTCGPISMKLLIPHRVIGRRERIKTSGKFRPLMCKVSKSGAKLPTSRKYPRATHASLRSGQRSQFARSLARWPVIRQRHGPIAREPGGVACSLPCGTVSNAFVLLSPV